MTISHSNWFQQEFERLKSDPDYYKISLQGDFSELVYCRMHELHMSKADLARALGVSRALVSNILKGNSNLTMATMSKVAFCLGMELQLTWRCLDVPGKGNKTRKRKAKDLQGQ
jgi:transcriptional regulator with XRE-family HTH domain